MTLQTLEYDSQPGLPRVAWGDVLAPGFAITFAGWIVAYISRLPGISAPGHVTVGLMLGMVLLGGFLTARYSGRGILAAVLAGAVSGLLNNLIVGSVLHDAAKAGEMGLAATRSAELPVPSMAIWFGGSIVLSAVLAGTGGIAGAFFPSKRRAEIRWTQVFATVLAAATLPLLAVGGLVTAFHSGLAVPDWPTSYGYNMFLFPLSKMQSTSGNFYEHAHRLLASLVGFCALTLAIYTTVAERRGWIKLMAWGIGFCILIQAILGGTRVTEKNVDLALAHGVFAQLVFAGMACLAAASSGAFVRRHAKTTPSASTDRALTGALFLGLVVQLILGAFVRHKNELVMLHISMAAVVAMLVLACGFRAWGLHGDVRPVKRSGLWLMALVTVQITLGVFALIYRSGPEGVPTVEGAVLTTAHQANGALLLATSAVLAVWTWRLVVPVEAGFPVVGEASLGRG